MKLEEFDDKNYGKYIPLMLHTERELVKLGRTWSEYGRDKVEGLTPIKYLTYLLYTEMPLNSFKYALEEVYMGMAHFFSDANRNGNIHRTTYIGKYKIEHDDGFFGCDKDYEENYTQKHIIYCDEIEIMTLYNQNFTDCIDKIVEHAGGYEPSRFEIGTIFNAQ